VEAALAEDLTSIQEHRAISKAGECVTDLITFRYAVLRNDLLQQQM